MNDYQFPTPKGRTDTEKRSRFFGLIIDGVALLPNVWWYVNLTLQRITDALKISLLSVQRYFFVISVPIQSIGLGAYLYNYFSAANKNLGKTAHLFYRIGMLALGVGMVIAILGFGITLSPAFLAVAYFIDPFLSLFKAGYYLIKYSREESPEQKQFYLDKMKSHLFYFVVVTLITLGIITLFLFPVIPLAVAVVASVVGIALMAVGFVYSRILDPAEKKPEEKSEKTEDTLSTQAKLAKKMSESNPKLVASYDKNSRDEFTLGKLFDKLFDFNKYSLTPDSVSIQPLRAEIVQLKDEIKQEYEQAKDSFIEKHIWSQAPKRLAKIKALGFLESLLDEFEKAENGHELGSFKIHGHEFVFANKPDLMKQIDEHVLNKYPGVYQSFFKDIGHVQACYNKSFSVLRGININDLQSDETIRPRVRGAS